MNPVFHLPIILRRTYLYCKNNMALYNSSSLTVLNTNDVLVVNGTFETSISSTYQEGSRTSSYDIYARIGHLFVIVVILTPGVFINMKFLNNIKHEQRKEQGKTLHRIMKNHAIAQVIFWPSILFLRWLIRVDQLIILSPYPCFYHYVGPILRFTYVAFRLYIGFNSVVVAICRICFIVYEHNISNYGIDKFKKFIYGGSILVPLGIAILAEGSIPVQNFDFLWQNFGGKTSATRVCRGAIANVNDIEMENQSPIYVFVQNNVSSYITISTKLVCFALVFIILSNTIEGIIYWYTWSYIKR